MREPTPDPGVRRDRPLPDAAAAPRAAPPLFAAIDLGTSNCRMMIATPARGGAMRVVDSFSRVVRLGEELPATGRLGEAAMARTLAALGVCADRLARRRVLAVSAVATEACRQAGNGDAFLARIRAETGIAVRAISPREEAGLIVESCADLLRPPGRRALLFDIGGGSTEIAWVRLADPRAGTGATLIAFASFPFGVVTLPGRIGVDPATPEGFARAVDHAEAAFAGFEAVHRIGREVAAGGVRLIGTSGTVTTLAGVTSGLARYDRRAIDGVSLPIARAHAAVASLRGLGPEGLARHPCVGAERAALTLPGCAIFEAIARLWRPEAVVVADRGLREGMLARMRRAHAKAPGAAEGMWPPAAPPALAARALGTGRAGLAP